LAGIAVAKRHQASPSIDAKQALGTVEIWWNRLRGKSIVERLQSTVDKCEASSVRLMTEGNSLDQFHFWGQLLDQTATMRNFGESGLFGAYCNELQERGEKEWLACFGSENIPCSKNIQCLPIALLNLAMLPSRRKLFLSYKKTQWNLDWRCVQREPIAQGTSSGKWAVSHSHCAFL
jgi:hypothetical protein